MRPVFSISLAVSIALLLATWLAVESRAQAPERISLAGLWIRNTELSDPPPSRGDQGGDQHGRGSNGGGRTGRGGHGGGGGYGRGGAGRSGGGRAAGDPDEIARMREALHGIVQPGDHLTITQTDAMVVLTDQDGRTTRLSPDGKKIKDDNTHIERKSRWDGGKLISEITGAEPGKITQTFSLDPDAHRLRIVVQNEGRDHQQHTLAHVYDADAR
jgi:hypothetical protein